MLNYYKKFQEFKDGKISEEEWKEYCATVIENLIEIDEAFKRLKF